MNHDEIQVALAHLDLKIPYGIPPGYGPGGLKVRIESENDWNNYTWNPPAGMTASDPDLAQDPGADPKPTWQQLEQALTEAENAALRRMLVSNVKGRFQREIRALYGASTFEQEVQNRLNDSVSAFDTTKNFQLRRRYHYIKNWLKTTASITHLKAFDVEAVSLLENLDQVWTTPEGSQGTLAAEDQATYGPGDS